MIIVTVAKLHLPHPGNPTNCARSSLNVPQTKLRATARLQQEIDASRRQKACDCEQHANHNLRIRLVGSIEHYAGVD